MLIVLAEDEQQTEANDEWEDKGISLIHSSFLSLRNQTYSHFQSASSPRCACLHMKSN